MLPPPKVTTNIDTDFEGALSSNLLFGVFAARFSDKHCPIGCVDETLLNPL